MSSLIFLSLHLKNELMSFVIIWLMTRCLLAWRRGYLSIEYSQIKNWLSKWETRRLLVQQLQPSTGTGDGKLYGSTIIQSQRVSFRGSCLTRLTGPKMYSVWLTKNHMLHTIYGEYPTNVPIVAFILNAPDTFHIVQILVLPPRINSLSNILLTGYRSNKLIQSWSHFYGVTFWLVVGRQCPYSAPPTPHTTSYLLELSLPLGTSMGHLSAEAS